MINPEVKSLCWTDDFPTNDGSPEMLEITATIGVQGEEHADNFRVIVCNPAWLASHVKSNFGVWPRGYLVLETISSKHVHETLENLSNNFKKSKNWDMFAERLNRYLLWEFEDYNDYQGRPSIGRT